MKPIGVLVKLLVLLGCSTPPITREAVVGSWTDRAAASRDSKPHARLRLLDDGSFAADSVPRQLAAHPNDTAPALVSGAGTWVIADDGYGRPGVRLAFRNVDGKEADYWNFLYGGRERGALTLHFHLADPDSGQPFTLYKE
jgi:hypothetical protein